MEFDRERNAAAANNRGCAPGRIRAGKTGIHRECTIRPAVRRGGHVCRIRLALRFRLLLNRPRMRRENSIQPLRAALQLSSVIGAVEVALRRSDQSIRPNPPPLEATDAHSIPRASGTRIGAGQRPVILGAFLPQLQPVHRQVQIRERSHKRLSEFRNRLSTHRRSITVGGQRPISGIKRSHTVPIPAAPRSRVTRRKLPQFGRINLHRPMVSTPPKRPHSAPD